MATFNPQFLGAMRQTAQRQFGAPGPGGGAQALSGQGGGAEVQQGLPPGIDPRAVAADPQGFARQQAQLRRAGGDPRRAAIMSDPQGFARQQAQLQQAGGDPRRAAMMQQLQQRLEQRQGGQGLMGRMLAARGQLGQTGPRQPQARVNLGFGTNPTTGQRFHRGFRDRSSAESGRLRGRQLLQQRLGRRRLGNQQVLKQRLAAR